MNPSPTKDLAELKEEIIRLGPWHLEVQVTPELSSSAFLEAPEETYEVPAGFTFFNPRAAHQGLMKAIYPGGLEGRSLLDCACNCGGYLFWTKELGAGSCFGFDAREHWIRQAEFLLEHRAWPSDGIHFEVLDLYDLPKRHPAPFDITLFLGIFYHLPDPLLGLKVAADATQELIVVDTATRTGLEDGALALEREGKEQKDVLSGIHGLSWRPTGPRVMEDIFHWLGFRAMRVVGNRPTPDRGADRGRMRVIAARDEGTLAAYDHAVESGRFVPG